MYRCVPFLPLYSVLSQPPIREADQPRMLFNCDCCISVLTQKQTLNRMQDTHIHTPQYPNSGIFGNSTLLDWLNTYTYPLEASLSDLDKARRVYSQCISRTLSHGTTTAAYYATTDLHSTNLLADLCLARGQRALVGRCCMDSDFNPDYYRDASPAAAMKDTRAAIEHVKKIDPNYNLLRPVVTPRFAPSCSSQLLRELGELSNTENIPSQTHISETKSEVELVKKLFPNSEHYAGVYDDHGFLSSRTILAHAVHLTADERRLIRSRDAKVSHCPLSNTALSSGLCPVRQLLDDGITVGLGTDVSGGYSPSILEAARQASMVSRTIAGAKVTLSVQEVLYLATRGGADVVGLEGVIGGFEVGMQWDAQMVVLDLVAEDGKGELRGPVDVFGWETWEEKVAKWVFCGDDRNTKMVWVKGRLVHQRQGS